MPPKKAEKAAAPQKSDEELRLANELAEKEVAVQTLSEAVKRSSARPCLICDSSQYYVGRSLIKFRSLDRHLENEDRLTQETKDLDKQLKACQKDLFDINEFLLNELKVPPFRPKVAHSTGLSGFNWDLPSLYEASVQVQALITAQLEQNLREADQRAEETSASHKVWLLRQCE